MENFTNISIPWAVAIFCAIVSFVLIILCLCLKSRNRNKHSDSFYSFDPEKSKSQLASNMPKIIANNKKQKYFSHNATVTYSSINVTSDFHDEMVPRESFPFGIFNLFRHIQRNKCKGDENDLTKVFSEDLEASNTEILCKKFDKSKLRLNWNEISDNDSTETATMIDKDDAFSCISAESKATFKSAVPHTRCNSIADTFKSVHSDN